MRDYEEDWEQNAAVGERDIVFSPRVGGGGREGLFTDLERLRCGRLCLIC
jgi:hypothetical protein